MLEFCGAKIKTDERVYEPAEDTLLALEALDRQLSKLAERKQNAKILDMGTGTGILGICAAKSQAVAKAVLADISDAAVKVARANVMLNGLEDKCDVVKSDLFENVKGKFDIIVFNAPYLKQEPNEPESEAQMLSGGKTGIELSERFLAEAKEHLSNDGVILLVASSLSNLPGLERFARSIGYNVKKAASRHIFFEDIVVYAISLSKP